MCKDSIKNSIITLYVIIRYLFINRFIGYIISI